ncbi:uncharacterized protein [Procambarus clarkii]|uniref:uncharacterized protein n=1 Tax=Procambarus clarkii TaxID=6728 RepID=UPI001E6735ED|nr:leucine-rich repeat extensin-like protein 5 [Procambarus clarkii]
MSQLEEEEAEDTKSSLSEKVMKETYKPLEEMEWPSCFPAPPSSPSNTSSSPSHEFLHEISPSPPPNFKHEASPSPPPDFRHEASTLPLRDTKYKETVLVLPESDLHDTFSSPTSPMYIEHHTSPSPPPDFRCDVTPTPHPNTPVRSPLSCSSPVSPPTHLINSLPPMCSQQKKSPSPPPDCRWIYVNDLQQHSSASSPRGSVASPSHVCRRGSSSSVSQQGAITLSPAKLQYENHYSPPGSLHSAPPLSPNLELTPQSPHESQNTSSSASTSQHDSSLLFLCNMSPSPPLPHFPNEDSSESPTQYDIPESDHSEHSQKSSTVMGAAIQNETLHHQDTPSSSPPMNQQSQLPVLTQLETETNRSSSCQQPPTPPPIPRFFDDDEDIPPTPPPIPIFFDVESPPITPPLPVKQRNLKLINQAEIKTENIHQQPLPRNEIYCMHSMLPTLDVIQESSPPESPFEAHQETSPPEPTFDVHERRHTEPPFDIAHKSPPPKPPFDINHRSPSPKSSSGTTPLKTPGEKGNEEPSLSPQSHIGLQDKEPSPPPSLCDLEDRSPSPSSPHNDLQDKGLSPPPPHTDLHHKDQSPPPHPDMHHKGQSPPPDTDLHHKGQSPLPDTDLHHKDLSPPPDTDLHHKNQSPPPDTDLHHKDQSPPPPHIDLQHKAPSPPASPTSTAADKSENLPSPEYFTLPDNWPSYPPFLFGDSDFPPP